MNPHQKALDSIFGDLDDMETKKMFGEPDGDEGTSITITISPKGASIDGASDNPGMESPTGEPDQEEAMAKGGMVPEAGETDDKSLPPFLRKKKGM